MNTISLVLYLAITVSGVPTFAIHSWTTEYNTIKECTDSRDAPTDEMKNWLYDNVDKYNRMGFTVTLKDSYFICKIPKESIKV